MHQLRAAAAAIILLAGTSAVAQTVFDTTLGEANQKTAEVSTQELRHIIKSGNAILLDARPPMEYAISHIPGAVNVAPQPGRPAHLYISDVAEVGRLLGGAKDKALVLYCNGPFCGKTKRLGTTSGAGTRTSGVISVSPSWLALVVQCRPTYPRCVHRSCKTRRIDARKPAASRLSRFQGPPYLLEWLRPGKDQGVMKQAKDDGRLPMEDHNTRIIVFGSNARDARAVADAIASEAFHNVSFVADPVEQVRRALR